MSFSPKQEMKDLTTAVKAQIDLEQWYIDSCMNIRARRMETLREKARVGDDSVIKKLYLKVSEKLAERLLADTGGSSNDLPTKQARSRRYIILRQLLSQMDVYELCYMVVCTAANAVTGTRGAKYKPTAAAVAGALADVYAEEIRIRAILRLQPTLPSMVEKVVGDAKSTLRNRKRVLSVMFHHKAGESKLPPCFRSVESKIDAGMALFHILCYPEAQPVIKIGKEYDYKKKDMIFKISPGTTLLDYINLDLPPVALAALTPSLGLFLDRPSRRDWGCTDSFLLRDVEPVRTHSYRGKMAAEAVHMIKESGGNAQLLQALTRLEKVPMRVNKALLNYITENEDYLRGEGILYTATPPQVDCPIDSSIKPKDMSPHELGKLREYKAHTEAGWNEYYKTRSRQLKQHQTLILAKKMATYDKFYYRWFADFRGRLYTLNMTLSPQASSLGKGLVEFAEGVPIKVMDWSDPAWCDLLEYGYRLRDGCAKLSTEEALLGASGWATVIGNRSIESMLAEWNPKPKEVIPFIAWVLEIQRLLATPQGIPAVTHHPIRKDATASSMQHMAAMSGEEKVLKLTGAHTSVVEPQDLYTSIVPDYQEQGLSRDVIKQECMTMAYNATDFQSTLDLMNFYQGEKGESVDFHEAKVIHDKVKAAVYAGLGNVGMLQSFLNQVCKILQADPESAAYAVTPTGMIMSFAKYKYPKKKCKFDFGGKGNKLLVFRVQRPELAVPSVQQTRQGWVANLIHSMDACLLHIALSDLFYLEDLHGKSKTLPPMLTIHDCIIGRPGEMGFLNAVMSRAFCEMYEPSLSGLPVALDNLMYFWGLDKTHPELYSKAIEMFKALPTNTYKNMRYLFI